MRSGNHTISQLQVHIVWVTKYRYHVLKGDVQKRCRDLIIQVCDAEDIRILKGVVSKDHVHMHIEYPPSMSVSDIVKKLKGRTSRKLQMEFKELSKRNWVKHFWAIGYGLWSTGNVTQDMVDEYLEHHRNPSNKDRDTMILE
jgi:putative transposase